VSHAVLMSVVNLCDSIRSDEVNKGQSSSAAALPLPVMTNRLFFNVLAIFNESEVLSTGVSNSGKSSNDDERQRLRLALTLLEREGASVLKFPPVQDDKCHATVPTTASVDLGTLIDERIAALDCALHQRWVERARRCSEPSPLRTRPDTVVCVGIVACRKQQKEHECRDALQFEQRLRGKRIPMVSAEWVLDHFSIASPSPIASTTTHAATRCRRKPCKRETTFLSHRQSDVFQPRLDLFTRSFEGPSDGAWLLPITHPYTVFDPHVFAHVVFSISRTIPTDLQQDIIETMCFFGATFSNDLIAMLDADDDSARGSPPRVVFLLVTSGAAKRSRSDAVRVSSENRDDSLRGSPSDNSIRLVTPNWVEQTIKAGIRVV